MSKANKTRLDLLLVELGLVETRQKAQALILAKEVLVNDEPLTKAGSLVSRDSSVRLRNPISPFVGRGGEKIDPLFDKFQISLTDVVAIDVGASTGGFTDAMLQRGARLVYAVDVGTAQLAEKLRQDERVIVHEKTHAKDLCQLQLNPVPTFATVDLSFIGLVKVLAAIASCLQSPAHLLCLVKPQFELEPDDIERGGVVRDQELHRKAIDKVKVFAESIGLQILGEEPAAVRGSKKGNQEYFLFLKKC